MKHNLSLVMHELVRSAWHMEPMFALGHFPLAQAFLSGKQVAALNSDLYRVRAMDDEEAGPTNDAERDTLNYFVDPTGRTHGAWKPNEELPNNLVSVVPFRGAVVKYSSSFSIGLVELEAMIKAAEANPKVIAHLLPFDTPGGSVYGTIVTSQTIRDLQKPVIGYIDSMCCSAGMELISGCDEIYASHAMDMIGSIGTLISYANMQPYWEKQGVEFHTIYASKSKLKGHIFEEADKGNYKPVLEEFLDPLNEDFLKTIQENIPALAQLSEKQREWVLSGPTFFAQQGVSFGIVDGILTFEAAIGRAFELGEASAKNQKTKIAVR